MNDKLDLQPVFSRIIVKRKEEVKEEDIKKIGSIFVPEVLQEDRKRELESKRATEGVVLAVGPEAEFIREGDTVFFGKYSGAEIERNGEKFLVCNEEDIIAIVHANP